MARLSQHRGERACGLETSTLIGRSPVCHLRLEASDVSKEHAIISWGRSGWVVRDLGSRNGTFVDDQILSVGEEHPLKLGLELRFGGKERWRVDSLEAPGLLAETVDAGELRRVIGDQMLAFVDGEELVASISRDQQDRWVLESGEQLRALDPAAEFELDGRRWALRVPTIMTSTVAAGEQLRITGAALKFKVGASGGLEMRAEVRGRTIAFQPRGHQQLICSLARLRLEDQARGCDDFEAGWITHPQLQQRLGYTRNFVNVNVHRARKQLEQAGFVDAACLVERRHGSGMLRIGVRHIEIEQIG